MTSSRAALVSSLAALTLLGLGLGAAGCSTTTDKLKARFGKEHGCEVDQVQVVGTDGKTYHASGCGQSADYVCPAFASMGDDARACEEPGVTKKPGAEPPPLPGPHTAPDPPGTLPK